MEEPSQESGQLTRAFSFWFICTRSRRENLFEGLGREGLAEVTLRARDIAGT